MARSKYSNGNGKPSTYEGGVIRAQCFNNIPFFPFKAQLAIVEKIFLDVWGSIVEESIYNHGLEILPLQRKPFGPV